MTATEETAMARLSYIKNPESAPKTQWINREFMQSSVRHICIDYEAPLDIYRGLILERVKPA